METTNHISSDINCELETILTSKIRDDVVRTIKKKFLTNFLCRCFKVFLVLLTFYAAIFYIPQINQNLSAISRLTITTILMPLFKCEYIYNERCLVSKYSHKKSQIGQDTDAIRDNRCAVCENLGKLTNFMLFPPNFIPNQNSLCFFFLKSI